MYQWENFGANVPVAKSRRYFANLPNEDADFDELTKFLKVSLKFTENLLKNFFHETRNFHLAHSKTCEFLQLIDKNREYLQNMKSQ